MREVGVVGGGWIVGEKEGREMLKNRYVGIIGGLRKMDREVRGVREGWNLRMMGRGESGMKHVKMG